MLHKAMEVFRLFTPKQREIGVSEAAPRCESYHGGMGSDGDTMARHAALAVDVITGVYGAAVADERAGVPNAVASLEEWACDPARFPDAWVREVRRTLAEARAARA
jgi:hypothetical protein